MKAVEALALVGGYVDQELLLRNEYLAAENEILRSKLPGRIQMTEAERIRLAYPTGPGDHTPSGIQAFRGLQERHGLAHAHQAAQISAFSAAVSARST